jgi:hypothetical protein
MDSPDLFALAWLQPVTPTAPGVILLRLSAAALLGAFLAFRPWRRLLKWVKPVELEIAQSQMLIAVAGVVMVVVIGDSTARAFGLVGLGAFVRFRSGLRDPRDAATMFVLISLGMSCGLGLIPEAVLVVAFVALVMLVHDWTSRPRPERIRLVLSVDDPRAAAKALRQGWPGLRVLELPAPGAGENRLVVDLEAESGVDAVVLQERVVGAGVQGLRSVALVLE